MFEKELIPKFENFWFVYNFMANWCSGWCCLPVGIFRIVVSGRVTERSQTL